MAELIGTSADETLLGGLENDVIDGGAGADVLFGGAGDDLLLGSAGDIGSYNQPTVSDTLSGGTGTDTLRGGGGDDTYAFDRGDGHDLIQDHYYYHARSPLGKIFSPVEQDGGVDTLEFGAGITADDLWVMVDGNDLIIGLRDGDTDLYNLDDLIRWQDANNSFRGLEAVTFADGSSLSLADLTSDLQGSAGDDFVDWSATAIDVDAGAGNDTIRAGDGGNTVTAGVGDDSVQSGDGADQVSGGDGADTVFTGGGNDLLSGGAGTDSLSAGDGADTLSGGDGADTLDGGDGDDLLFGGLGDDELRGSAGEIGDYNQPEGNDTLSGGVGSDLLRGGGGNDVYSFARGDGQDTVHDEYFYHAQSELGHIDNPVLQDGGVDVVRFAEGISASDVWVDLIGDDLVVGLRDGDTELLDLQDRIVIQDWRTADRRVESFEGGCAATLDGL
ncbi:MAG: hypothetical protein HQ481_06550, partial [Alphaproteobacteria bacterium]|nr:hypothetical protein [Alphaproteobacteria bacterium]